MSAVHYWVSFDGGKTLCGIRSARNPRIDSEADTVKGDSVQIVGGTNNKATCGRCIRLAPAGMSPRLTPGE
jgi:hypothetical protein